MAMETLVLGKCGNASTPVELIKGDNYTQKIMMRVPRYFGGVDLAPLAWSVTVENAAGATDEYALSAIRGEDAIEMEWILGGTATAVPGIVKFKLSGFGEDRNILVWQSGTYHIRVKDTFAHVPGSETQAALTEVQKLIIYVDGELNKVIKAGTDAAEAAKAANKAADRANSVADGKNEGRITALEQFTTKPGEPYAVEGKLVQLDNFEGMPMNAVTRIEPVQSGSGDPSPSNIRPISGHTGAKLTKCGKNLLNYDAWKGCTVEGGNAVWENNGVTITANSADAYTDFTPTKFPEAARIAVHEGETITLSWEEPTNSAGRIHIFGNGSSASAVSVYNQSKKSLTYTVPTGVTFITFRFSVQNAGGTISYKNIMLELGSTATAYEPYQGETFSASFGQTVYGGTLDWGKGVLTIDRTMVTLNGTENYIRFGDAVNYPHLFVITDEFSLVGVQLPHENNVSSHYRSHRDKFDENCFYLEGSGLRPYINDIRFTNADELKTFIAAQYAAGTPVQICYKLATPITIQLTPAQLTALQGMNNIFCDAGETTVSGRKDILWLTSGLIEQIDTLKKAIISLGGNV